MCGSLGKRVLFEIAIFPMVDSPPRVQTWAASLRHLSWPCSDSVPAHVSVAAKPSVLLVPTTMSLIAAFPDETLPLWGINNIKPSLATVCLTSITRVRPQSPLLYQLSIYRPGGHSGDLWASLLWRQAVG